MEEKPYTLGTWRTFTTYRCRYCPFDSTEEAVAIEHYVERHAPRPRGQVPSPILVADKSGREVTAPPTPSLQEEAGESIELTTDEIAALQEPLVSIAKRAYKRREV